MTSTPQQPARQPSSDFYPTLIIVAGLALIGFLLSTQEIVAVGPFVLAIIGFVANEIYKMRQSRANTEKLAVMAPRVDEAVAQSQDNGAQLAAIAPQVDAAVAAVADNTQLTADTKGLVNGQATEFRQQTAEFKQALVEMSAQKTEIAAQKAEIAALIELARSTLAEVTARDAGMEAGRAQIIAENAPPESIP